MESKKIIITAEKLNDNYDVAISASMSLPDLMGILEKGMIVAAKMLIDNHDEEHDCPDLRKAKQILQFHTR